MSDDMNINILNLSSYLFIWHAAEVVKRKTHKSKSHAVGQKMTRTFDKM